MRRHAELVTGGVTCPRGQVSFLGLEVCSFSRGHHWPGQRWRRSLEHRARAPSVCLAVSLSLSHEQMVLSTGQWTDVHGSIHRYGPFVPLLTTRLYPSPNFPCLPSPLAVLPQPPHTLSSYTLPLRALALLGHSARPLCSATLPTDDFLCHCCSTITFSS